ncbi:ATP-binding protein [Burkholderia glumae]|uniref:ATP-binding protein n=1 Tax=Burkholderia glumae TaxID=337 RepID=UPI002150E978|nr:ATP-binding protein [Burkholderia glumae]
MTRVAKNTSDDTLEPLVLRFAHNIIEHLGLKLYQNKPTNVLAELVSNSWDADANHVWIDLLTNNRGAPSAIAVADDGFGMGVGDLADKYLVVGQPKRNPKTPDERTPGDRLPMGRKGIGKLAPFGVARTLDLVTVRDGLVTWLRFDYDAMLNQSETSGEVSSYEPLEFSRRQVLQDVDCESAGELAEVVKKFLNRISADGKGTLVLASKLTVKRPITPDALLESLGRRFTVTLARPDFVVTVNDKQVSEGDAFPEWEIRIPETGEQTFTVKTPVGDKQISAWVGFVKNAAWSNEQAGVGVYAHGKIAQDRPFFFGNKGNEIFSRYMYGVVTADWIDELNHDAISTDRTSINWEDESLEGFYEWGVQQVKSWISLYEKHRKSEAKKENIDLVDTVVARHAELKLRDTEKDHLIELLSDVTPKLGKEAENREKLVEATVRAWVHEPARRLIKRLWEEASEFDAHKFTATVRQLSDQLVPESLSLAVVFAQRVYALTQLERHIMHGKETQLQKLIEEFPWILDNEFESVFPRKALKSLVEEAESAGLMQHRNVHLPENLQYTKPDFVFLGDATDSKILVVELKGPDDTAAWPEFQQLTSYTSYLQSRFTKAEVQGILVARSFDEGIAKQKPPTITFAEWPKLLLRSRKEHMVLLASLLAGTDADAQDARVQQICELGGVPVQDFLAQMSLSSPELERLGAQLAAAKR